MILGGGQPDRLPGGVDDLPLGVESGDPVGLAPVRPLQVGVPADDVAQPAQVVEVDVEVGHDDVFGVLAAHVPFPPGDPVGDTAGQLGVVGGDQLEGDGVDLVGQHDGLYLGAADQGGVGGRCAGLVQRRDRDFHRVGHTGGDAPLETDR
jgi:hypothetical protein